MKFRILPQAILIVILGLTAGAASVFAADHPQPLTGDFATPVTDAAIDNASLTEWCGGAEHPVGDPNSIRQRVWTRNTAPVAGAFFAYGACTQIGPRHFRIGFHTAIPVGTVLVRGSDQLSVLRPGATYPGNLADDSQWIPAQRILNRQLSGAPVDLASYGAWIFPPGTQTRALRFTHVAVMNDSKFVGFIGSLYVLAGRFANLAPEATVLASSNSTATPLLIDERYNDRQIWDNGPDFARPVTSANPEWVVLSWPRPVTLHGLAALWAGFNAADVEVFSGPDDLSLHNSPEANWHPIGQPYSLRNQYPLLLGVDWLDFGKTVQTRAVRLRMTQATNESRDPHLAGSTHNGNRVWLGEIMALSPLDAKDPQSAILPITSSTVNPPIPVRFTLASPGYVSLVIDDAQGNRVRNLVSCLLSAPQIDPV